MSYMKEAVSPITVGTEVQPDTYSWYDSGEYPMVSGVNAIVTDFEPLPPKRELYASVKMNKRTLASMGPREVLSKVKQKVAKSLLEQLLATDAIKVTSFVNPKTGAVTFKAAVALDDAA